MRGWREVEGGPVKFDAVSIQAPAAALSTARPKCKTLQLTTKEQTAFSAEIKFAPCVPSELLNRTILARNFA